VVRRQTQWQQRPEGVEAGSGKVMRLSRGQEGAGVESVAARCPAGLEAHVAG